MAAAEQLVERAELLLEAERPQQARELAERALGLEPGHAGALFVLANACLMAGDADSALAAAHGSVAAAPTSAYAHAQLAFMHCRRGEPAEALPAAQEAVRLSPHWSEPHRMLADALMGTRQLPEAQAAAERAIELDPQNADAHLLLGRIRARQYKHEDATAAWEQALKIDPHHKYTQRELARSPADTPLSSPSEVARGMDRAMRVLAQWPGTREDRLALGHGLRKALRAVNLLLLEATVVCWLLARWDNGGVYWLERLSLALPLVYGAFWWRAAEPRVRSWSLRQLRERWRLGAWLGTAVLALALAHLGAGLHERGLVEAAIGVTLLARVQLLFERRRFEAEPDRPVSLLRKYDAWFYACWLGPTGAVGWGLWQVLPWWGALPLAVLALLLLAVPVARMTHRRELKDSTPAADL